ncbi:hypothetical protein [Streptomyces sp. NPDC096013]|uniref:hypothetical protein n=1 Tax=Streptomyces sp. NPDC096013 TaxID=3366069 RepID=UPI003811013A
MTARSRHPRHIRHPHRTHGTHRTAILATTAAAAALTAGLLTACDPTTPTAPSNVSADSAASAASHSLTCLKNWSAISDSLKAIHDAGVDVAKDPTRTDESIDTINRNLTKLEGEDPDSDAGDDKVGKAVDDLDKAISDYNRSILNGDTTPDSSKIDAAAERLKDACTNG